MIRVVALASRSLSATSSLVLEVLDLFCCSFRCSSFSVHRPASFFFWIDARCKVVVDSMVVPI